MPFRRTVPAAALALAAALVLPGAAAASGLAPAGRPSSPAGKTAPAPADYTSLYRALRDGSVRALVIDDRGAAGATAEVTLASGKRVAVVLPTAYQPLLDRAAAAGVRASVQRAGRGTSAASVLKTLLLVLLLVGGIVLIVRLRRAGGAGAAGGGPASLGRLRKDVELTGVPAVSFADVAGCDEAVEEVREFVEFLREPARFAALGAKMPSGLILHGPPGTGKTLLAKALAGEAGIPFFYISGSDFVDRYVGVGAKRVRELFAQARAKAPAVVCIDEIDAVARTREGAGEGGHGERDQTLNQILVELDGFASTPVQKAAPQGQRRTTMQPAAKDAPGAAEPPVVTPKPLVVIAMTNRLDMLDPALLRPGRLSRKIQISAPDASGRLAILRAHSRGKPLAADVDLKALADNAAGMSGAQLADICNEAAIMAARESRTEITAADLREAQLRVVAGPRRRSAPIAPGEDRKIAFHEAGHVICAEFSERHDKAQQVSIEPRGAAMGLAFYGQTDRSLHDPALLHESMVCALGGRAAEQTFFGEISSGAANDLERVNEVARTAVQSFGFSEHFGQLAGDPRLYGDRTRTTIDEEVRRLVDAAYRDALRLVERRREELERLALALLERRVLDRDEIVAAIDGEPAAGSVVSIESERARRRSRLPEPDHGRAAVFQAGRGWELRPVSAAFAWARGQRDRLGRLADADYT